VSSSKLQQIAAFFRGDHPQFYDPKFVAKADGREVTRVRSMGTVRVTLDVVTKGLVSHGYVTSASAGATK
jgi:B9 domain-containing protein 1